MLPNDSSLGARKCKLKSPNKYSFDYICNSNYSF